MTNGYQYLTGVWLVTPQLQPEGIAKEIPARPETKLKLGGEFLRKPQGEALGK